jgi:hypothetical protein
LTSFATFALRNMTALFLELGELFTSAVLRLFAYAGVVASRSARRRSKAGTM